MLNFWTNYSIVKGVITKNNPFYIQFYISNNCHLKCKMCNIVDSNRNIKEVDLEHIEKIAKNLKKIGVGVVLLTGGEPFLRNDIVDIVKMFRKFGLTPRLQTAGLLSKFDNIYECSQNGARDINVSLDTLDEAKADDINGVKGSFKKAIQTIGRISREIPNHDTVLALGCVLSSYNIHDVEDVLEFANRIGWSLSLVPVHINKRNKELHFRGHDESFVFQENQYDEVYALIDRLKNKKKNGESIFDSYEYLDSIPAFITTGHPTWRKNDQCDSPNLYFAILPDGRFVPCCDQDFDEDLYVYDERFPEIFKSKPFRQKVDAITKACPGCNFGSYPEMTLTARSFRTFFERVRLELKSVGGKKRSFSDEELFKIIEDIKGKKNSEVN